MKKIAILMMTLLLALGLAACGSGSTESTESTQNTENTEAAAPSETEEAAAGAGDTLVVYFSATGSGNWLDGDRLDGDSSEDELKTWVEGQK